jgi:hypothetical protein
MLGIAVARLGKFVSGDVDLSMLGSHASSSGAWFMRRGRPAGELGAASGVVGEGVEDANRVGASPAANGAVVRVSC